MAGIIKNQILKHLSRFVKNLSSDKISLSTLKGEGELHNVELEEEVLTELLALPTWMKLTHAHCNRVLIRIHWTKLKSVPIHLSLDEVHIRVEACEELRQGTPTTETIPNSLGKYGFVNKVIDGITATVNSVEITFHSQAFESKVQISRIRVESKSPEWHKVELSGTRLKDMQKGETLIFKEMEWQTLRLEARSTTELHLAPLRLLTNQAKARIVMKKKLSDSQVVGVRLSLILDDLLWVLTDSQILAALHFMNSLSGLIKQATEITQKVKAVRKLESLPEYQAQLSQASAMQKDARTDMSLKKFDAFDVKETSYHFICEKIDLHFCDDPGNGRSQHPDLQEGGALQLSLTQVMVDFYPYHLARGSRKFWPKYTDNTLAHWLHQALQSFRISLIDTLSLESMHPPLTRTQNQASSQLPDGSHLRESITEQFAKLMTTSLILKIQDLRLFKVTTASKRDSPQSFVSTFIERPKDMPVVHTEFAWFYYPGEVCFPLPSPKIFAHVNPIQINLDTCTILWLNAFISNLQHSMSTESASAESDYVDIRIELIMPKVIFENKTVYPGQKERPQSVHFQVSRVVLSNYRSADTGTMHQLTQCLELLQRGDLVYGTDFPSAQSDMSLVTEKFLKHAEGQDKLRPVKKIRCTSFQELASELTKDMMWTDPRDVWYAFMDPFWADFRIETKKRRPSTEEKKSTARRSLSRKATIDKPTKSIVFPFIDSVPLTIWLHPNKVKNGDVEMQNIQALFSTSGICKVQLNHYQYLFVMRMAEALGELSLFITLDSVQIAGKNVLNNLVTFLGCSPSIEVSLLFPQPLPDKADTLSLEVDSTIPESSSADAELDQHGPTSVEIARGRKSFQHAAPLPVSLSTSALVSAPGSLSNSPLNLHGSNPALETIRSNLTQNLKHGISNLAVSFNKGGISTPDSEIASNWSNFSSESSSENNFITLDVADPETVSLASSSRLYHNNKAGEELDEDDGVEIATEVIEENDLTERSTPSPMFPTEDALLRNENDETVVGLLTARLEGIEIAQESRGLESTVKIQCKSVGINECTSIAWNEFQKKFAARCRTWPEENQVLGSPTQKRALKVRLSQKIAGEAFKQELVSDANTAHMKSIRSTNPRVNLTDRPGDSSPIRACITNSTQVFLDARVDFRNEDKFVLHMSTAMGLADFVEDEIVPTPFPLQLEIIGIDLEMIEDRPSANITSPGPVPIFVSISNPLPVARDKHGVFHIGERCAQSLLSTNSSNGSSMGDGNHASSSSKQETDLLQEDLEKALKQLNLAQNKNNVLEAELESIPDLKMMIVQLQEQVVKLQEEKSAHLSLLRKYQNQNNKL